MWEEERLLVLVHPKLPLARGVLGGVERAGGPEELPGQIEHLTLGLDTPGAFELVLPKYPDNLLLVLLDLVHQFWGERTRGFGVQAVLGAPTG